MKDKFEVYMHTSKTSNKSYIGYTRLGISKRLHKHYTNALAGYDNNFYRAIRKYGIYDFKSKILKVCETQEEALEYEKDFILEYDTFKNGYNMSLGGIGGNVVGNLPSEKYEEWINKIKKNNSGEGNPRHSGLSDDDIIEYAKQCFLEHGHWHTSYWNKDYTSKYNIPKSFSKCRFNGRGLNGFKENLLKSLIEDGYNVDNTIFSPKRTNEMNEKASQYRKGKMWYTNIYTKEKKLFTQCEIQNLNNSWIKGKNSK